MSNYELQKAKQKSLFHKLYAGNEKLKEEQKVKRPKK